jgi:hypothetical protein
MKRKMFRKTIFGSFSEAYNLAYRDQANVIKAAKGIAEKTYPELLPSAESKRLLAIHVSAGDLIQLQAESIAEQLGCRCVVLDFAPVERHRREAVPE